MCLETDDGLLASFKTLIEISDGVRVIKAEDLIFDESKVIGSLSKLLKDGIDVVPEQAYFMGEKGAKYFRFAIRSDNGSV